MQSKCWWYEKLFMKDLTMTTMYIQRLSVICFFGDLLSPAVYSTLRWAGQICTFKNSFHYTSILSLFLGSSKQNQVKQQPHLLRKLTSQHKNSFWPALSRLEWGPALNIFVNSEQAYNFYTELFCSDHTNSEEKRNVFAFLGFTSQIAKAISCGFK